MRKLNVTNKIIMKHTSSLAIVVAERSWAVAIWTALAAAAKAGAPSD